MATPPTHVEQVLEGALVCAFTCIDSAGRPVTHPLLPLYDAQSKKLYFTSSILFSKKLEHVKRNPKVSVLFSNRQFIKSPEFHVVLIKGDARVLEDDIHHGWERLLPLWRKKEPYIDAYVKQRIALPLFWERGIIEVMPKKIYVWENGDTAREPVVYEVNTHAKPTQ